MRSSPDEAETASLLSSRVEKFFIVPCFPFRTPQELLDRTLLSISDFSRILAARCLSQAFFACDREQNRVGQRSASDRLWTHAIEKQNRQEHRNQAIAQKFRATVKTNVASFEPGMSQ